VLDKLQPKFAPQAYGKVAVLAGGTSAERDISLNSGEAVCSALKTCGIDAIIIDPANNIYQELKSHKVDRAFIALHGRGGEDGVMQGFLKTLGIPFTGSNVMGSALAMNKFLSKQVWQQMEIKTAPFVQLGINDIKTEKEAANLFSDLGKILFLKPVKEGSSVGMSKVSSPAECLSGLEQAYKYDKQILVERFIAGAEYSVPIIQNQTLPSIRVNTPRDFYDYQAKYQVNDTEYNCPSGLNKQDEALLSGIALKAFSAIGCSGWGRVDFIRSESDGEFYILEVNTIPGMTQSSLVPKSAQAKGISFDELVIQILNTSFEQGVIQGENAYV
jgi:D-alanine-D-alanine ligase